MNLNGQGTYLKPSLAPLTQLKSAFLLTTFASIEFAPTVGTSRLSQPRPKPRRCDQAVRRDGAGSVYPGSSEQVFYKSAGRRLRRTGLGRDGGRLAPGIGGELLESDLHGY